MSSGRRRTAAMPWRRGRAYALVAPDGRIAVRLPDWDLFTAAFELPGSEPLYENERRVGHWVLLPGAVRHAPARSANGCAGRRAHRGRRVSDERALSFGSVAEDYEATRPGWPVEPFAMAFEQFGVPRSPRCRGRRCRHGQAHAHARADRRHARRRRARPGAARRAAPPAAGCDRARRHRGGAAAGDGERRRRVRRPGLPLVRSRPCARRVGARPAPAGHHDRGLELTARGRHLVRRGDRVPHARTPPTCRRRRWTGPPR